MSSQPVCAIPDRYKHQVYSLRPAKTEFGRQVRESQFSRICYKCKKWWSNRKQWENDTALIRKETGMNGAIIRIHEHKHCGGLMAIGDKTT